MFVLLSTPANVTKYPSCHSDPTAHRPDTQTADQPHRHKPGAAPGRYGDSDSARTARTPRVSIACRRVQPNVRVMRLAVGMVMGMVAGGGWRVVVAVGMVAGDG